MDNNLFDDLVASIKEALLGHWAEVGSLAKSLMLHIGRSGQYLAGWIIYLLLIPVWATLTVR